MMDFEVVSGLVASLGAMRFFPADPPVRLALVQTMGEMTDDVEVVRWLVKKLRTEYSEWPGEHEMRKVFCAAYRPKDGIVVQGGAERDYTFTLGESQRWPPMSNEEYRKSLHESPKKQLEAGPMYAESEAVIAALAAKIPQMPSAKPLAHPSREQWDFDARLKSVLTPPQDRPEQPKVGV